MRWDKTALVLLGAAGAMLFVLSLWWLIGTYAFEMLVFDDRPIHPPPAEKVDGKEDAPATEPGLPRESPSWLRRVPRTELVERGQLGDTFGVVGSLLAGLSLAFVVYTVNLQREQLRQQQTQLQQQQEQISRQGREFHLLRYEAEDDKLAALAEEYLDPDHEGSRYHGSVMLETIGPLLTNKCKGPPGHDVEAAKRVQELVLAHVARGDRTIGTVYIAAMIRYLNGTREAAANGGSGLDEFGDAYIQADEKRAEAVFKSFRILLHTYTRYARVWLSRERERKAADLSQAPDYMEESSRRWGFTLFAIMSDIEAYTRGAGIRGDAYGTVKEYLIAAGYLAEEGPAGGGQGGADGWSLPAA